ncbi:hypothetical protein GQ53DRAFT_77802 [Thozetella sp. PMI_491]|nr:hypothetical protein GQ53DRAFT_77802 [Thozetella sp. PMI_491]
MCVCVCVSFKKKGKQHEAPPPKAGLCERPSPSFLLYADYDRPPDRHEHHHIALEPKGVTSEIQRAKVQSTHHQPRGCPAPAQTSKPSTALLTSAQARTQIGPERGRLSESETVPLPPPRRLGPSRRRSASLVAIPFRISAAAVVDGVAAHTPKHREPPPPLLLLPTLFFLYIIFFFLVSVVSAL